MQTFSSLGEEIEEIHHTRLLCSRQSRPDNYYLIMKALQTETLHVIPTPPNSAKKLRILMYKNTVRLCALDLPRHLVVKS